MKTSKPASTHHHLLLLPFLAWPGLQEDIIKFHLSCSRSPRQLQTPKTRTTTTTAIRDVVWRGEGGVVPCSTSNISPASRLRAPAPPSFRQQQQQVPKKWFSFLPLFFAPIPRDIFRRRRVRHCIFPGFPPLCVSALAAAAAAAAAMRASCCTLRFRPTFVSGRRFSPRIRLRLLLHSVSPSRCLRFSSFSLCLC